MLLEPTQLLEDYLGRRVQDISGLEVVDINDDLKSTGITSSNLARLAADVYEYTGIELSFEEINKAESLKGLAEYVANSIASICEGEANEMSEDSLEFWLDSLSEGSGNSGEGPTEKKIEITDYRELIDKSVDIIGEKFKQVAASQMSVQLVIVEKAKSTPVQRIPVSINNSSENRLKNQIDSKVMGGYLRTVLSETDVINSLKLDERLEIDHQLQPDLIINVAY